MQDFHNDWLNTRPYFYNTKTHKVSKQLEECIDFENFEWDWAGLTDYLDFGYIVFGNTPIKNVKFIQANQSLEVGNDSLNVINNSNLKVRKDASSPEEIEHLTLSYLQDKINESDRVLLPLSGGFDSRYLASVFKENFHNEIQAFTFGATFKQSDCDEVRFAKKVGEILNIQHSQVRIDGIFNYISEWDKLFGVSTHSHGTHQMMFYNKIRETKGSFTKTISGLVGDAWAGKVLIPKILNPQDVINLGLTHRMNADSNYAVNKSSFYREKYFSQYRFELEDPEFRLIETIRNKMMLLRYLEVVPEYYGSQVISPFADETIARRMLKLPDREKDERRWQTNYFKSKNLNIEDFVESTRKNNQHLKSMFVKQRKPYLKPSLLKEIYNVERINYINKHIGNSTLSQMELYLSMPFRGRSLILSFLPKNDLIEIICEYMTLLPLQLLVEKRNNYLITKL